MSLLRQGGASTLKALCHYFLCHFLLGEGGVSGEKDKALLFVVFFLLTASLSACSQVFKSIIHETNVSNQVIYLRGIHSNEMEMFNRKMEEKDLVFKCELCDKKYATDGSLKHHKNLKHYTVHTVKLDFFLSQNKGQICKL